MITFKSYLTEHVNWDTTERMGSGGITGAVISAFRGTQKQIKPRTPAMMSPGGRPSSMVTGDVVRMKSDAGRVHGGVFHVDKVEGQHAYLSHHDPATGQQSPMFYKGTNKQVRVHMSNLQLHDSSSKMNVYEPYPHATPSDVHPNTPSDKNTSFHTGRVTQQVHNAGATGDSWQGREKAKGHRKNDAILAYKAKEKLPELGPTRFERNYRN